MTMPEFITLLIFLLITLYTYLLLALYFIIKAIDRHYQNIVKRINEVLNKRITDRE